MQHFDPYKAACVPAQARRARGQRAYLSGAAAEQAVSLRYVEEGSELAATRWRGQGGEIDLIFLDGPVIVFVEVKKGRSFDIALNRLSEMQMQRIHAAASEYLGTTPLGQLSDVRFDLALVDESGQTRIMKDAFGHF